MKKIKIISTLLVTLFSTNIVANDFYYKSKQENNNLTRYEKLVTDSLVIDEIIINSNETQKEIKFKGLQNKENMNNDYKGSLKVEKSGNDSNIIILTMAEKNKQKKFDIFLDTKKTYYSFIEELINANYISNLKYMSEGLFEINLINENDTSYLLSMLSLDNKEQFLQDLIKENSNNVKEKLTIFNQENIIKIDKYELEIENILKININADLIITDNELLFSNVVIESNVKKQVEALKEIEEIFKIKLNKGENLQEIKEISIKIN